MIKILELSGGTCATRAALRNLAIPVKSIDYVEIDEKPQDSNRSDRKYTQKMAAQKVGVSSQVWSDIETGRKAPGPSFYCMVHETFGIDLNWLITGEGKE